MKPKINGILVVEGSNDASYLSSLFDVEIVTTNGYECPDEEIDYLKEASKHIDIIIVTDPDKAGEEIRNKLHSCGFKCKDVIVDINKCNKNNKHGVAECEKDEIKAKFEDFLIFNEQKREEIKSWNLLSLNINKKKREYLCKTFHLGLCNNKKFVQRLNTLKIGLTDIKRELMNYDNQ